MEDSAAGTYTEAETGLEMIRIPAGEFIYGEDDRLDYLPGVWISKTPVTNAQYLRFVRASGHGSLQHWQGKTPKVEPANHPVTYVSWHDAQAYVDWAVMHLPTEEEWEKAARGTDGRIYPWGNEWRAGYRNTRVAGISSTAPVGQYSPQGDSPYGCVDMAGNVWEWTAPLWDKEHDWRVLRGGAWSGLQNRAPAANRNWIHPTDGYLDLGFRVVVRRSLSP